jgi:hypothetical protein
MSAKWLGRCDDWSAKDAHLFHDFDAGRREITYRTFRKHVGKEEVDYMDQHFGVPLSRDFHVRFYTGTFDGKRVVCLMHSAYHYLWQLPMTSQTTR